LYDAWHYAAEDDTDTVKLNPAEIKIQQSLLGSGLAGSQSHDRDPLGILVKEWDGRTHEIEKS
jgi:hypothetical protein